MAAGTTLAAGRFRSFASGRRFFQSEAPLTDLADLTCTADDLAALAGVSGRHIRRLAIPKAGRNRYLLTDAIPALIEAMSGGDAGAELTRERVRKTRAEATLAELQLAKASAEVAPLSEIARAWERTTAQIRARMMQIPQRAVVQLISEPDETRIKDVLANEIKLALTDASNPEITETDLDEDHAENDDQED